MAQLFDQSLGGGSTGAAQWARYNAEQEAKKKAIAPSSNVGGLSLQRTTQVAGPGGTTSYESQYGPANTSSASMAGLRGVGGGSANALAETTQQIRDAEARNRLAELKASAGYAKDARSQQAGLESAEATKSLGEREAANQRAQAAMLAQYKDIAGSGGDTTASPTAGPNVNEQAARDAAFARAKEQSGLIARSSLEGLRNSLARRGISGGGYANMRTAEALAPAADQLQDFTREGLIQDYNRAGQIGDREAAAQLTREQMANQKQASLLGLLSSGGKLY